MATKLEKALKREVDVNGVTFTVTISPHGVNAVEKGRRKGTELTWEQIVRGDVTLGHDLADSIAIAKT